MPGAGNLQVIVFIEIIMPALLFIRATAGLGVPQRPIRLPASTLCDTVTRVPGGLRHRASRGH